MEDLTFVKISDSTIFNFNLVKYIDHNKQNDVYRIHFSASGDMSPNFIDIHTNTNLCASLHAILEDGLRTLKTIPDPEKSNGCLFIKINDSLFLNWNRIKYIRYDCVSDRFYLLFTSRLFRKDFGMKICSDADLYAYLMKNLKAPISIEDKLGFVKYDDSTIVNWNSVKYINYEQSKDTFELHLSYNEDTKHRTFKISEGCAYDHLKKIYDSPERIQTNSRNFVRLETSIINWYHVKYVDHNAGEFFRIYFSAHKNKPLRKTLRSSEPMLMDYFNQKLLSKQKPNITTLKMEPLLFNFDGHAILNWSTAHYIVRGLLPFNVYNFHIHLSPNRYWDYSFIKFSRDNNYEFLVQLFA